MSAPAPVLFDAPGPKARRRIRVLTVIAVLGLLALVVVALLRLAERGQLAAELWAPLLDPRDESFAQVWTNLGNGLLVTLQAAVFATLLSLVIGTVVCVTRLMAPRPVRIPLVALVEVLRGLPVIVTILLSSVVPRALGTPIEDLTALVVGLVLYNSVIISEILRAGVRSLPRGQVEAGLAIGLRPTQTMLVIQLPQAFRAMLPSLISQLVVVVKDTALVAFVLNGVTELARAGDQIRGFLRNPLQTFAVVAVIYMVVNLLLERLARLVEARLSRASSPSEDADEAAEAVRA